METEGGGRQGREAEFGCEQKLNFKVSAFPEISLLPLVFCSSTNMCIEEGPHSPEWGTGGDHLQHYIPCERALLWELVFSA